MPRSREINLEGWQALIDGLLEAVWLVDPENLCILAVNRPALKLHEMSTEALIGRHVGDLAAAPEDLLFWEGLDGERPDRLLSDTLVLRVDGLPIHVVRKVSPVLIEGTLCFYLVGMSDRSEQRRVESELEKLLAELRATLESTADGMLVTDLDGAIRGYNHRFAELWALPEALLTQRDDSAIYGWMEQTVLDSVGYWEQRVAIDLEPFSESTRLIALKTGKVLECVSLPQYARGQPSGRVYSYRDMTQRFADESQLRLAAQVFEQSLDAIFITDTEQRIVAANFSFERITGFAKESVIGQLPELFVANLDNNICYQRVRDHLALEGVWQGEVWSRRQDGYAYLCLLSTVRIADERGQELHCIGFFKDLSEALAARKRIEELAYTDALTGLPNRLLLADHFDLTLKMAMRSGTPFAMLFLDIDHFKHINDSLGHHFGDRVLVLVAERLRQCLRQIDTICRLGGDEFVILLPQTSTSGAEISSMRILEAISQPYQVDEVAFSLSGSIGIALYPSDGDSMDDLIKNADSAMYVAKAQGRSCYRFYHREMNLGLLSRMKLDHAMRLALMRGAFELAFQPQLDLVSHQVVGVEALIRWHDEVLGQVPPSEFIPVAEETGTIVAIGHWVLEQAVRQAAIWYRQERGLVVAVNVSALQFQQVGFIARVEKVLNTAGLPAQFLELELTESILIRDADEGLRRLNALSALGVKLSIDDFGTGYSSLNYLKRFPIQRLKIDRSFISDLPENNDDAAIVRAIISLGHALHRRVIAEGVESEGQKQFLMQEGCDEIQGFLLAQAMPPEVLEQWLQDRDRS